MNKIVVIANKRFEKGLVAFINSYRKADVKTPLVIIDTGLEKEYPYETVKSEFKGDGLKKADWMSDCSPYLQLKLNTIKADKIMYLEADMLILKNIDHLFEYINNINVIACMDDAAKATMEGENYIDNCGRYFIKGSELSKKYARCKGYNGGLIGASKTVYKFLSLFYSAYILDYEDQYRLLAQSLLNQFFIEENIPVTDIGLEYNFSGINEYYDYPELYKVNFDKNWKVNFNGVDISILHFTGKDKPFFNEDKHVLRGLWEYYYNNGELFDGN